MTRTVSAETERLEAPWAVGATTSGTLAGVLAYPLRSDGGLSAPRRNRWIPGESRRRPAPVQKLARGGPSRPPAEPVACRRVRTCLRPRTAPCSASRCLLKAPLGEQGGGELRDLILDQGLNARTCTEACCDQCAYRGTLCVRHRQDHEGKYEPLGQFLRKQRTQEVPLTFREIEKITGVKLPPKAQHHRAWWSNNPDNNVMTKVWLAAGFASAQVDMEGRKLVFRRVANAPEPTGGFAEPAQKPYATKDGRHPASAR